MASVKELEIALVNADKAGDTDAARKLAAVIKRSREQAISPTGIPTAGEEGIQAIPRPTPAPTLSERAAGAGEAALSLGTAATGGALGFVGGTAKGLAQEILSGEFGTPQAASRVQEAAMQGSQAMTYAPRGQVGQEYAQAAGEALQPLEAIAPLAGEIGQVARSVRGAIPSRVPKLAPKKETFLDTLQKVESGGDYGVVNASGHTGKYQFAEKTAKPYLDKMGATWDDFKANPDIQEQTVRMFTEDNIAGLKAAGHEPTQLNLWLAHNQGLRGAKQILSGKVSDDVRKNMASNMGGSGLAPTPENFLKVWSKKFGDESVDLPEGAPVKPRMTTEEIGQTAKQAASGSREAKNKLAIETSINPEALKAAERLDIDVPIDVLSDSELLRQTVGLTRSQIGAESAVWKEAVQSMANKADDVMAKLEGADSKSVISGKIKDSLDTARADIKSQTTKLYNEVDNSIPKETVIEPKSLRQTLNEIATEVGGKEQMSPIEKKILNLIESDKVTYGGLLREKTLVGEAIAGKQTPYGNIGAASLKRLYSAIKNDQMDNVEKLGGIEAREKLHFANRLTVKQKALENRIIGAFGKEGEGSIAALMDRAITQGAKGDITALNKLLKAVPDDMQKEVIATALTELTKSQRAGEAGMFDFARYAKLYQGLRRNAPIYKKVIDAIGEDKHQMLSDLYQISKRVTDARANVITTGKANQEILKGMYTENMLEKIVNQTIAGVARKTAVGNLMLDKLITSQQDVVKSIGELLRSQDFKELAIEAATKEPSRAKVNKVAFSAPFKKWVKKVTKNKNTKASVELASDPRAWIYTSITQQNKEEK